jgi:hypothetical protein
MMRFRWQFFSTTGLLILVVLVAISFNSGVTSARQGATAFPTNTIEGDDNLPIGAAQSNTTTPTLTEAPAEPTIGPFEYPDNIAHRSAFS